MIGYGHTKNILSTFSVYNTNYILPFPSYLSFLSLSLLSPRKRSNSTTLTHMYLDKLTFPFWWELFCYWKWWWSKSLKDTERERVYVKVYERKRGKSSFLFEWNQEWMMMTLYSKTSSNVIRFPFFRSHPLSLTSLSLSLNLYCITIFHFRSPFFTRENFLFLSSIQKKSYPHSTL